MAFVVILFCGCDGGAEFDPFPAAIRLKRSLTLDRREKTIREAIRKSSVKSKIEPPVAKIASYSEPPRYQAPRAIRDQSLTCRGYYPARKGEDDLGRPGQHIGAPKKQPPLDELRLAIAQRAGINASVEEYAELSESAYVNLDSESSGSMATDSGVLDSSFALFAGAETTDVSFAESFAESSHDSVKAARDAFETFFNGIVRSLAGGGRDFNDFHGPTIIERLRQQGTDDQSARRWFLRALLLLLSQGDLNIEKRQLEIAGTLMERNKEALGQDILAFMSESWQNRPRDLSSRLSKQMKSEIVLKTTFASELNVVLPSALSDVHVRIAVLIQKVQRSILTVLLNEGGQQLKVAPIRVPRGKLTEQQIRQLATQMYRLPAYLFASRMVMEVAEQDRGSRRAAANVSRQNHLTALLQRLIPLISDSANSVEDQVLFVGGRLMALGFIEGCRVEFSPALARAIVDSATPTVHSPRMNRIASGFLNIIHPSLLSEVGLQAGDLTRFIFSQ